MSEFGTFCNRGDSPSRRRLWSVLFLVTSLACADSGAGGCEGISGCTSGAGCVDLGCGPGCDAVPYDPEGEIIQQAVQVRLTPQALEFLEDELEPLAAGLVGDGESISMCVPRGSLAPLVSYCYAAPMGACVETADCPVDATCQLGSCYYSSCGIEGDAVVTGCTIDVGISDVTLAPVAVEDGPDRLDVTVLLDLDEYIPVGSCPALHVQGTGVPVTASVVFSVDDAAEGDVAIPGTSDRVWFDIQDIGFDLSGLVLSVPDDLGPFGDPEVCGNPEDAVDLIQDLLDDAAGPALRSAVEGFICAPCGEGGACIEGASCGEEPAVCRYDATDACVPAWLGTEGAMDLAGLLGGVGSRANHPLSLLFYLANYAEADAQGLSLGVHAGLYSGSDACVPLAPMPSTETVPRSAQLTAGLDDKDDPFMLGIAVDRSVLDLGLWALHQSGAMCLAIDSATSLGGSAPPLTTSLIGLLFGIGDSLNALTRVSEAPDIGDAALLFAVRPQQPPTVSLGRGEVDGTTVVEPTLVLSMPQLFIDLYAWIEGRYVRVFTLDADLELPLALVPSEDGGSIRILRGELDDIFTRAEVINAGLLTEEEVAGIPAALPSLVSILEGALPAELTDAIELPELAGLRLHLGESGITTVENDSMLAILADFEAATPVPLGQVVAPEVRARLREVRLPGSETLAGVDAARAAGVPADLDALRSQVVVELETEGRGPEREYSYRLNGGLWRQFRAGDTLVVDDPGLILEGTHQLEFQSRDAASGDDVSRVSEPVAVTIDLSLPEIEVTVDDDGVARIAARDRLYGADDLVVRWRVRDASGEETAWQELGADGLVDLYALGEVAALDVEASDPSGHARYVTRELAIHGRTTNTSDGGGDGCGGCAVGASGGRIDASWALLLVGLVAVGRRRRSLLAALALALLLAGCADGRRGGTPVVDEDMGEDAEVDVDAADLPGEEPDASEDLAPDLVEDSGGCEEDVDCADFSCSGEERPFCDEGACACAEPCGGACGAGELCCIPEDTCEEGPGGCADFTCDAREEPTVVTEGSYDPTTCELIETVCGCVPSPPDPGAFLTAAVTPSDEILVAAYDWRHGDLMVGRLVPPTGSEMVDADIEWEAIDGLPVDRLDPDVGRYADLAVAADGTAHLAYYDRSSRSPRYARGTLGSSGYTWSTMAIEADVPGGTYTSIAVSADGVPAVAYFAPSVPLEDEGRATELRVAWADAATPTSWTVETISTRERAAETPSYATLPEGNGLYPALGWLSTGELALAWYDHDRGNVMFATSTGGTFAAAVPVIVDGETPGEGGPVDTGDVGQFLAMTIGEGDEVHLTYVDATRDRLLYRSLSADEAEVVDDGIRGEAAVSEHTLVGDDSSLLLLEDGTPQVVYMDTTHHVAVVSHRPEIGWTQATVLLEAEGAVVGFYADQVALSDGRTFVLAYRHAAEREARGVVVRAVE